MQNTNYWKCVWWSTANNEGFPPHLLGLIKSSVNRCGLRPGLYEVYYLYKNKKDFSGYEIDIACLFRRNSNENKRIGNSFYLLVVLSRLFSAWRDIPKLSAAIDWLLFDRFRVSEIRSCSTCLSVGNCSEKEINGLFSNSNCLESASSVGRFW